MAVVNEKKAAPTKKVEKKASSDTITVSVAVLGANVRDIELPAGSTLKDALGAAGYDVANNKEIMEGVRLNGQQAGLNDPITHGAFVTVSPRVQGG